MKLKFILIESKYLCVFMLSDTYCEMKRIPISILFLMCWHFFWFKVKIHVFNYKALHIVPFSIPITKIYFVRIL